MYVYTYTHVYTCIYIYMSIHIYTYIHIYIHTYIHTHTYMCVYIYICIYIYVCIYIYSRITNTLHKKVTRKGDNHAHFLAPRKFMCTHPTYHFTEFPLAAEFGATNKTVHANPVHLVHLCHDVCVDMTHTHT